MVLSLYTIKKVCLFFTFCKTISPPHTLAIISLPKNIRHVNNNYRILWWNLNRYQILSLQIFRFISHLISKLNKISIYSINSLLKWLQHFQIFHFTQVTFIGVISKKLNIKQTDSITQLQSLHHHIVITIHHDLNVHPFIV
jgi:hypothetical protein